MFFNNDNVELVMKTERQSRTSQTFFYIFHQFDASFLIPLLIEYEKS